MRSDIASRKSSEADAVVATALLALAEVFCFASWAIDYR